MSGRSRKAGNGGEEKQKELLVLYLMMMAAMIAMAARRAAPEEEGGGGGPGELRGGQTFVDDDPKRQAVPACSFQRESKRGRHFVMAMMNR